MGKPLRIITKCSPALRPEKVKGKWTVVTSGGATPGMHSLLVVVRTALLGECWLGSQPYHEPAGRALCPAPLSEPG